MTANMTKQLGLSLLCFLLTHEIKGSTMPKAPVAKQESKELTIHKHTRQDPYYWLNDRNDKEVIQYLEAENTYTDHVMKPTQTLQASLYEEMKSRYKQSDETVPYQHGDYLYYSKTETDKDYRVFCRKKNKNEGLGPEQVILDANQLAEGQNYFDIGSLRVSPDGRLLAYTVDTVGRRIYTLHVKDIESGKLLGIKIENMTGNFVWANDNQTIFYTKQDTQTLRSYQVYRTNIHDTKLEKLVFEESDDTFSVYLGKTRTERFLVISSGSKTSSEMRFLDANKPMDNWTIFSPRKPSVEYSIDDGGDQFVILTNYKAKNFQIMQTPYETTNIKYWQSLIEHDSDRYIEDFEVFKDYIVVSEKKEGINYFRVLNRKEKKSYYMDFDESAFLIYPEINRSFDTEIFRFGYESLTTPDSIYAFNLKSKEKKLLKREAVLDESFDPNDYTSIRTYAKATDGSDIPISIVHRKDIKKDGKNPVLLYGYGSYGMTIDPNFNANRISILKRGFVFAIAHIRGSSILGRSWYDQGKMLNKKNTFSDFINVAEHLISEKYTQPQHLYAMGGSAGGLLMGAVINMRPELFNGVIAAVPFVDVLTTMLDDTIPLTTSEYDEWGNPNDKIYYNYMLSYSPYDNVQEQKYPHLLVTTGFHDSQVQYWEPAKWVAKLRKMKKDKNLLLFQTNMDAGHSGASGRFSYLKEIALDYAFLLMLEGIRD